MLLTYQIRINTLFYKLFTSLQIKYQFSLSNKLFSPYEAN